VRHLKMVGLCLLAVFALGAVAASAAQAEGPEWGRCVKLAKNKGKYKDANCTELEGKVKHAGKPTEEFVPKAKGDYEWVGGADTTCYPEPAKKGKYKDAACAELEGKTNGKGEFKAKEKGGYEKIVGGPKFTGVGGAGTLQANYQLCVVELEPEEDYEVRLPASHCKEVLPYGKPLGVECKSEHASGEAVGTNGVANVHVRFTGCLALGSVACESAGLAPGEIETNTLKGSLGYIEKATHSVGVLLEPNTANGLFVKFDCPKLNKEIIVGVGNATEGAVYAPEATGGYDGIISPITPVDQMTPTFTQEYKTNASEENIPTHFEGGHIDLLEAALIAEEPEEKEFFEEWGVNYSSMWSKAGETITNVNTVEGEDEIKA